jgi:hypothetical protein
VFSHWDLRQLLAAIEEGRVGLVESEPSPDQRQAALDHINSEENDGVVV